MRLWLPLANIRSPALGWADRTGVVLAQLGGPDILDDVRPFLYNFFLDLIPDNLRAPRPLWKPMAWALSTWRAPRSKSLYAAIGGGSPLRAQTEAQADALCAELRRRARPLPVYVAMRNWHPDSRRALRAAQADGVERLIFLPLYPQYSFATTRSSLNELRRVISLSAYRPAVNVIEEYCEQPRYIEALVELIRRHLAAFKTDAAGIRLIFSAHGLPVKYVARGDPYTEHVRRTMRATLAKLQHPGPTHLSFQSRLGPASWLQPATEALIAQLGHEGAKAVCVVPVAFVSEHVETLNEIDIQYAQVARDHGIAEFGRVCAVKCHPSFIACLADLVEAAIDGDPLTVQAGAAASGETS